MKKTNFTLLSKTFKMCTILFVLGFYSFSSNAQCSFDFNNMFIEEPGLACGDLEANVLLNPGFEDGAAGNAIADNQPPINPDFIPNWESIGQSSAAGGWGNISVEQFPNQFSPCFNSGFEPMPRSGAKVTKIFGESLFDQQIRSQPYPAAEGETWVASMFLTSPEGCGDRLFGSHVLEVHVEFVDADNCLILFDSYASSERFEEVNADGTWQQRKAVAIAPPGTAGVRIAAVYLDFELIGLGGPGGGAVYMDDAALQRVTSSPIIFTGTAGDDCTAPIAIPAFGTAPFDFCVSDNFSVASIENDFNGTLDASGDYPFGTTTVSWIAKDDAGRESEPCEIEVIIGGTGAVNGIMACNDLINVSLTDSQNGCSLVSADGILEGNGYGCYDQYEIVRVHELFGDCVPEEAPSGNFWVNCNDVGQTITLKVIDPVSGNYCWGDAYVEDKVQPTLECDVTFTDINGVDQVGTTFNLTCSEDPNSIDLPNPVDNCDRSMDMTVNLISETSTGDLCGVFTVVRVYQSADSHGNKTNLCTHTINVVQPDVTFPDDITWTCEQYAFNQDVISATALHPAILQNAAAMDMMRVCCDVPVTGDDVAGVDPYQSGSSWWLDTEDLDVTLDPRYDDNIDNPRTDRDPLCGTSTTERDDASEAYNLSLNIGCPYLETCDINPGGHTPELIQIPVYSSTSRDVEGLEDADVLELTGSGQPNVVGTTCKFAVTHIDQLLEACDGVGTASTFKIIRTWTVLNWCTGVTTTDVQIIKVLDQKVPEFSYPVDQNDDSIYNTTLLANQTTGSGNHVECFSSGLIPSPIVTDNCSGVAELRVFTPVGEGVAVTNNNGDIVGYSVPSPFLSKGEHDIVFQAIDGCGNTARDTVVFNVIDGTPPVSICREITQVSISNEEDGITSISASDLDEGSYDQCGPVYFKVRRMEEFGCDKVNLDTHGEIGNTSNARDDEEWFDDKVKFCCQDIGDSVMVILRVYDRNPGPGAIHTNDDATEGFFHENGTRGDSGNRITYDDQFLNGTYNDCMVEVLIEDKVRPECVAPADVWINCDELPDNVDYTDDAALDALFGTATALDNCNAELQYVSTRENLDLCGVGSVTRTFRAEDAFGNRSIGSCRQVIMVQPIINYCITFPQDYEGECDNANAPDDLTFVENGCDLLAVSSEEEPFNAGGPAGDECRKVIRTWRVINWCEYDGISGPVRIERDRNGDNRIDDGEYCSTGTTLIYTPNPTQIFYTSTGYYEWKQHVKIFDNTAPEVAYDGTTKFCGGDLDEDPCTGQVDIELDITELCTDAITTTWAISAFSNTFSSTDINGSDALSMRLPLGTHTIRFSVTDDCGNTSQIDITFSVVDCKAPTPVCHNGLSIDVMPLSGMVELWASDFDASSFDYCSDFTFRANVITDVNGDGIITSDDYVTVLPADDFIILDCDDVASGLTMVQLWVAEQDGTADDACADNQDNDYCVTFVEVQDNNGVCSSSRVAVGGKITNEDNEAVENVTLEVNAAGSMLNSVVTDATGEYEFLLPTGGDFSITPMRNDDVANGVSTFDLVLVSKHILNVSLLDSPYKMLAADANRSGSISTLDLVAIRKVVLRLTNEFPNNTSWRFVEKSHIFTSNNPWATNVPELMNINNLTVNELNTNFTAIKVGDVNGDSRANGILGIDDRSFNGNFEFRVEDQNFKAGEEVAVTFTSEDLQSVDGYQFTLKFNEKALELVSIENGVSTAENFGTAMANNGFITTSWNGTATDSEAFTVIFNAKAAGTLSNEIAVSSALTAAEAYEGVDYKNVSINFGGNVASNEFTLYQNTPNPFKGETVIGFDLPTASAATLTVSDVSGKILKVVNGDFAKGHNTVTLSSVELSTGVLYYQLDTEGFTQTMKMVVIK